MAMFGNTYPATYQPMQYPQYQMQQPMSQGQQLQNAQQFAQPTMNSTIVWVKHQKEAEDYLVAPNNSVVFMDEAMTHLYMKSADQFGRPSFTSKMLTDDTPTRDTQPSEPSISIDMDKYMTKEEFRKWVDDTLEKRLSELKPVRQNNNQRRKEGGNNA